MDARTVSKRAPITQRGTSLISRGLREKLIVAFCLMSVVPILVLLYVVVNYVFPHLKTWWDLALVVGLAAGIAFLGFIVVRSLVLPIVKLSSEARAIAAGNVEGQIEVRALDEVGALGTALNQITQRVRDNMTHLRAYGEETRNLHLEINKRILALSNLLQISNLITQSAKLEEVVAFSLDKLSQMEQAELNCLLESTEEPNSFIVRAAAGMDRAQAEALVNVQVSAPWLRRAVAEHTVLLIDEKASVADRESLQKVFGMTNAVCQPLSSMGNGVAVLLSANRLDHFSFDEDTVDLLNVFAKQVTIAIENGLLLRQTEELEIMDGLTGLYNAKYTKNRLEEEIQRSIRFHRPCSLVVFNVDNFRYFRDLYGGPVADRILCQVAEIIRGELSEVDRAGRTGVDEFSLILPERNKREAIELAEAIRHRVELGVFTDGLRRLSGKISVSGGVSENPIDGSNSDELFKRAHEALRSAKNRGKNRVSQTTKVRPSLHSEER